MALEMPRRYLYHLKLSLKTENIILIRAYLLRINGDKVMSETELANRVLEEVKTYFEEYNYTTTGFSIYDEVSNTCEDNEYFVEISTHGDFSSSVIQNIVEKDLVFSIDVRKNRLIINCCVKNSRYV
jgi:hypothetical protein